MAILAQVTVQFAMVTPMSAVPLVMSHSIPELKPADIRISGCIVVHVLGMFLPGFFTGDFIAILGELPVMCTGLVLQAMSLVIALTGVDYGQFYGSLALLGVGWNLAFVAGTMLVVKSHSLNERTKVTAANEMLRFTANAVACVLASGLPWNTVCFVCLCALVPPAAVLSWQWYRHVRLQRDGLVSSAC